jgi:hypothetical protein
MAALGHLYSRTTARRLQDDRRQQGLTVAEIKPTADAARGRSRHGSKNPKIYAPPRDKACPDVQLGGPGGGI